jgi:hypothetical protein
MRILRAISRRQESAESSSTIGLENPSMCFFPVRYFLGPGVALQIDARETAGIRPCHAGTTCLPTNHRAVRAADLDHPRRLPDVVDPHAEQHDHDENQQTDQRPVEKPTERPT